MSATLTSVETYPDICPHCNERLLHPTKVRNKFDEDLTKNQIYRRHRRIHFTCFDVPEEDQGKYVCGADEHPELPEDCEFETKTFEVTFHYEMVEQISVEAEHKHEAKRIAEELQLYDGEVTHTLHTETESWGEASQASEQYLQEQGLLPDDWDGSLSEDISEIEHLDIVSLGGDA